MTCTGFPPCRAAAAAADFMCGGRGDGEAAACCVDELLWMSAASDSEAALPGGLLDAALPPGGDHVPPEAVGDSISVPTESSMAAWEMASRFPNWDCVYRRDACRCDTDIKHGGSTGAEAAHATAPEAPAPNGAEWRATSGGKPLAVRAAERAAASVTGGALASSSTSLLSALTVAYAAVLARRAMRHKLT